MELDKIIEVYGVSNSDSDECVFDKVENAIECMISNMDNDDDTFGGGNEGLFYASKTYLLNNKNNLLDKRKQFSISEHKIRAFVITEKEYENLPEFEGF